MAQKHPVESSDASGRATKRQRMTNAAAQTVSEDFVHLSVNDLKAHLAFRQEIDFRTRQGIQAVRKFIKDGTDAETGRLRPTVLQTLAGYLNATTPAEVSESNLALSDLMQTWSLASQFEAESLFAFITSLLASLLEVISSELALRTQGTAICQSILYDAQVKLLEKGLGARGKTKVPLNVACLRLLAEITTFDGGAFCRSVHRRHAVLLDQSDDFLNPRRKTTEKKLTTRSVDLRHHALTLLLANIRVQGADTKTEILGEARRVKVIFNYLDDDRPSDIAAILHTLDTHFLSDIQVSRSSKARVLSEASLSKVTALMRRQGADVEDGEVDVAGAAETFLTKLCCTPGRGVLIDHTGWQEGTATQESFTDRVPVRNSKLASFIQELRPYKDRKHLNLILAIFKAAPELVADYFLWKKNFSFEPKLTSTWTGYAGFLLSVAQLEPPPLAPGADLPNESVVVENLLPSSTLSKAFNRCFSLSPFTAFAASKILAASLIKLSKTLEMARSTTDASASKSWCDRITKAFSERCPDVQSITVALKNCPEDNSILRESLYHLLSLLQGLVPLICLDAKFDVTVPLADALADPDDSTADAFCSLNVERLSSLASSSPQDFDWFHKSDRLRLSPFTSIMRLATTNGNNRLIKIVESILFRHSILQSTALADPKRQSVEPINASILLHQTLVPHSDVLPLFDFFDNCVRRFSQRPMKYEGDAKMLISRGENSPLSLLTVVVAEQWPHFLKAHGGNDVLYVASWLADWLSGSYQIGENKIALRQIKQRIYEALPEGKARDLFQRCVLEKHFDIRKLVTKSSDNNGMPAEDSFSHDASGEIEKTYNALTGLETVPENFPELFKWTRKELPDAVEDGDVAALVRCLCVPDRSTRVQAQSQLKTLAAKVNASDYSEKQQLHLMLMELIETSMQWDLQEPLPSFVGALAASAVDILNTPTHALYPKLNKFLIRAPEWDPSHLPSYWKDKAFAKPPSKDDALMTEALWFCDILFQGLKTQKDFDIYRRRQVFETLLVRYDTLGPAFQEAVLRFLWRCTHIEGGSATLITRCGIVGWCDMHDQDTKLQALKKRILATCGRHRVEEWSSGRI